MNDSVRSSKSVFRPHCASMAHRPRAPARVNQRRTFGKSDFVQMTFSSVSKKKKIDVCPRNRCFYPVWVLRVACFLCVCAEMTVSKLVSTFVHFVIILFKRRWKHGISDGRFLRIQSSSSHQFRPISVWLLIIFQFLRKTSSKNSRNDS